jgi:Arc/MetJ family transcription regulator
MWVCDTKAYAMSEKDEGVRAPISGKLEGYSGTGGNFETYFLRDLYNRGEIDDELIEEVINQNHMSTSPEDVIAVLEDTSGDSIPRGLADHLSDIAQVMVDLN